MELKRSNRLLFKKFLHYLLPTMVTYVAVSLNEFADSMIVARLLGSKAMAIVNLGMPLMLAMAAIYTLLGSGAAMVYAVALGRRDHETAGSSFTAAMFTALVTGLLFPALGFLLFRPLSGILCSDASLTALFDGYLRILLYSAPLLIILLTFSSILPSAGYPVASTVVIVTANVVNIIMDYVYIHVIGMGVEGAAWATFTGYACAVLVVVIGLVSGKMKLYVNRKIAASFRVIRDVLKAGAPDAMSQIGFALQFAVCNMLAASCAGEDAVVAFSLCIQSSSVLSVFLGALLGSALPLLAVVHGQRDYRGEAGILNTAMRGQLLVAFLGTVLFEAFASQFAALYNITEPGQAALAITALRIYVLLYIPRYAVIMYYRYLKVIGLTGYATWMSMLDGFGAIIPIAWLMTALFGTTGLWVAFPLTSLLLFLAMILLNRRYAARSGGKLRGLMLYEQDEENELIADVTISGNPEEISGISEVVQKLCEERGADHRKAVATGLAVEEIAVYAANRKKQDAYMDLIVRLDHDAIVIEFRSIGTIYNPLADMEDDIPENVLLLRSIADVENEYILGMNSTRLTIRGIGSGQKEEEKTP